MSPLDRIAQLSDENALLRSQLRDAQEQAKRDSETIARLAADKQEIGAALRDYRFDISRFTEIVDHKQEAKAWDEVSDLLRKFGIPPYSTHETMTLAEISRHA